MNPELKNTKLSEDDVKRLFFLQRKFGNKWSKFSAELPGKSQNLLKNTFYSTIRRNLRKFNKNKLEFEKFRGSIANFLLIPEIRLILEAEKSLSKEEFLKISLSAGALNETQKVSQTVPRSSEVDYDEIDLDDLFDL